MSMRVGSYFDEGVTPKFLALFQIPTATSLGVAELGQRDNRL